MLEFIRRGSESGWMDEEQAKQWARIAIDRAHEPQPQQFDRVQLWENNVFAALANAVAWLDSFLLDARAVILWPGAGRASAIEPIDSAMRELLRVQGARMESWWQQVPASAKTQRGAWDIGLRQLVPFEVAANAINEQALFWSMFDNRPLIISRPWVLKREVAQLWVDWAVEQARAILGDPVAARTTFRVRSRAENAARVDQSGQSLAELERTARDFPVHYSGGDAESQRMQRTPPLAPQQPAQPTQPEQPSAQPTQPTPQPMPSPTTQPTAQNSGSGAALVVGAVVVGGLLWWANAASERKKRKKKK